MPSFDPDFIERVVCVSTAHITQKDSELLSRDALHSNAFVVYEKSTGDESYGYFVRVLDLNDDPEVLDTARNAGYSDAMIGLVTAADEAGCSWLEIDCDGQTYEDFPTFEW